jgi:hypothetical protein
MKIQMRDAGFQVRPFLLALALNAIWINASEVFRYFVFVMPMMRAALPGVDNVAPMDVQVFLIWGAWDTILLVFATLVVTLWITVFGNGTKQAIAAGAIVWAGIFCIFWLAMLNMNLATPAIAATALSLAFIEMIVAALITRWALLTQPSGTPR